MVDGVVVYAVQETVCLLLLHQYNLELVLLVQGEELFCHDYFFKDRKVCNICIYQYFFHQTAFAEHQKNMVKLNGISEKCTGVKRIDWSDSLKGELSLHLNYISLPLQPNRSVQNINL